MRALATKNPYIRLSSKILVPGYAPHRVLTSVLPSSVWRQRHPLPNWGLLLLLDWIASKLLPATIITFICGIVLVFHDAGLYWYKWYPLHWANVAADCPTETRRRHLRHLRWENMFTLLYLQCLLATSVSSVRSNTIGLSTGRMGQAF